MKVMESSILKKNLTNRNQGQDGFTCEFCDHLRKELYC